MGMGDGDEEYIVLINEEEQYSLWLSWKEIPIGWKRVGPKGNKKICDEYVKKMWTDMRPKSLREQMAKQQQQKQKKEKMKVL